VNKKQSVINKIFQIAAVVPFIFFMGITAVQASDQENECFNDIQGKIAWNDNKDLNWDAENVKQLCQGTSKPSEPGKCFQKLKSGQVSCELGQKQYLGMEKHSKTLFRHKRC